MGIRYISIRIRIGCEDCFYGRNSARDKAQFYSIAKGGLLELHSQILVVLELKYMSVAEYKEGSNAPWTGIRLVSGLIKSAPSRP